MQYNYLKLLRQDWVQFTDSLAAIVVQVHLPWEGEGMGVVELVRLLPCVGWPVPVLLAAHCPIRALYGWMSPGTVNANVEVPAPAESATILVEVPAHLRC